MESGSDVHVGIKLYYEDGTIRRVTVTREVLGSYDQVMEALQKIYDEAVFHPELKLRYIDAEGDKCTISSSIEWECFLAQQTPEQVIKLYISEGPNQGRYFKDGPPPVTQSLYVLDPSHQDTNVEPSRHQLPLQDNPTLAINVPQCLASLFPGGKILPYNLPSWLQPYAQPKRVVDGNNTTSQADGEGEVVDLDINITGLCEELQRQAYTLLGADAIQEQIEKAMAYLECVLEMNPTHTIGLYNMACAQARLGNTEEAIQALTRAVEQGGYANGQHMQTDPDLFSLHSLPAYCALVQRLLPQEPEDLRKDEGFVVVEAETKEDEVKQDEVKKDDEVKQDEVKNEAETKVDEVKQDEVKKEDEVKKDDGVASFQYPAQLRQLLDMGFEQGVSMARLLARRGNLDSALNDLIG